MNTDKEESGKLFSVDQLDYYISSLKNTNKRLLQNLYLGKENLAASITEGNLLFHYHPQRYLNIYKKEWDFFRLYFYIADPTSYNIDYLNAKTVCDLFYRKKSDTIRELFNTIGFTEYANFTKYSKRGDVAESFIECPFISYVAEKGFYQALISCFDIHTDFVPDEEMAKSFLSENHCFSYVNTEGRLYGGSVVSLKGSVATEEFIFVLPEYRGRGISSILRSYYPQISKYTGSSISRYVSWVKDDNTASWKHLLESGYVAGEHKTTLLRG